MCIRFIDNVLVRIQRPYKIVNYDKWLNIHKNMYCMKKIVVVAHEAIFYIYILDYSYHKETILCHFHIFNQHRHITHTYK